MGTRETPGRQLTQSLLDYLRDKQGLLLLDNCEHLLGATAVLADALLNTCPQLKILATSRDVLGIGGEQRFAVPSLALPSIDASSKASAAGQSESVRLFVERASAVAPRFVLDDSNAGIVAEICRQLDGIPLAIELAAARVSLLGVKEIQSKLSDRFRLLAGGKQTSVSRPQTLRATIQWSYDQLAEGDRQLLRSLSVFAGSWTLESATVVSGKGRDEFDVLESLTQLVQKSLVVVEMPDPGEARHRFLETVRHYAVEKLDAAGESEAVRDRHLGFFLSLCEKAAPKLLGSDQVAWSARLEREHENLVVAINRSAGAENGGAKGLRMAGALWRFWYARGHFESGRKTIARVLDHKDARASSPERAHVLNGAGLLALQQGDVVAARRHYQESLAIYSELNDEKGMAAAFNGLGAVTGHGKGDYPAARHYFEKSSDLYRNIGDRRGVAIALNNLAEVFLRGGDYAPAVSLCRESLELRRESGDSQGIALTLSNLALSLMRQDEFGEARTLLIESIRIVMELTHKFRGADTLDMVVEFAAGTGEAEAAARFAAAADTLRQDLGTPRAQAEIREREVVLAKIRNQLGGDRMARVWVEGRKLDFEKVVREALAWLQGQGQGGN